MRFLTTEQKLWMFKKTIKVGNFYPFPSTRFTVYAEPDYSSGIEIDTNPFTKSLAGHFFLVKKIENGFCKGNFLKRPTDRDMYITEWELSKRPLIEMLFIFLICLLPLTIYNWFFNSDFKNHDNKNLVDTDILNK